jgi:hypothetical protein
VEDRVNTTASEGLEDISSAICFLKSKTLVLPNRVGNLERKSFLLKMFLEISTTSIFMFTQASKCIQRFRDKRADKFKEHFINV